MVNLAPVSNQVENLSVKFIQCRKSGICMKLQELDSLRDLEKLVMQLYYMLICSRLSLYTRGCQCTSNSYPAFVVCCIFHLMFSYCQTELLSPQTCNILINFNIQYILGSRYVFSRSEFRSKNRLIIIQFAKPSSSTFSINSD